MSTPAPTAATAPASVQVECLNCGHGSCFAADDERVRDRPLSELTRHLRCSECGSRAVRAVRRDTPRDLARSMRTRMGPRRP